MEECLSYNSSSSLPTTGDPAVKWLKWIARLSLGLVVVAIIVLACLPHILDAIIRNRLFDIRRQGYPISTADLDDSKLRTDENAALIYAEAFDTMDDPDAHEDFDTLTRFLSWQERAMDPTLWSQAERIVRNHQPAIVIAGKASQRPDCRFPVNWRDGPLDVRFPHLAKVRRLTTLLAASAILSAHAGQMDRAAEHVNLAYKASESLHREPTLIGQQARAECLNIASKALQTILSYGDINEDQAKKLHETLVQIDPYTGFVRAMWGERAMGLDMLEGVRKGDKRIISELLNDQTSVAALRPGPKMTWTYRLRAADDELFYMRKMESQIAAARFPYRLVKPEVREERPAFPVYAIGSTILCPNFGESARQRDETVARVYGDRILIALATHKYLFSSYPKSLRELSQLFDWPLPKDPFSGKDFIYKRRDKGFVLYSIGRNLKDDGGHTYEVSPSDEDSLPYLTFADRVSADIVWQGDR